MNLLLTPVIPNRLTIKVYIINNYNFYYSSNNIIDISTPESTKAGISCLLILTGAVRVATIYKGAESKRLYLLINSSFISI